MVKNILAMSPAKLRKRGAFIADIPITKLITVIFLFKRFDTELNDTRRTYNSSFHVVWVRIVAMMTAKTMKTIT